MSIIEKAQALEEEARTQEDEVRRGRRAEMLLKDPLIVEAFEALDRAFYQAFRDISPTDHQGLIHIRLLVKCLEEFQGFFSEILHTGQLTQRQVKETLMHENQMEELERQRLRR